MEMGIARCCCPYAYWKQANHHMHRRNGDVVVILILICTLALTKSPYAYGNYHMRTGKNMQLVPVCKRGLPYAYGDTPNFVKIPYAYEIPICIQ